MKDQTHTNILWIDDEIMVSPHMQLNSKLIEQEGFKVFRASSSEIAKKYLVSDKTNIDMVIQDIMRPEKGVPSSRAGIHFFETYLKVNHPTIPCIFHSARLDDPAIVSLLSSFPNCHYVPLSSPSELSIVIKSLVSEKEEIFKSEVDKQRLEDFQLIYTNISQELIDLLAQQPEHIYKLSGRKFEELIAELLEREGFDVILTPKTKDGGIDIYASYELPVGNILTVVECKKYNNNRPALMWLGLSMALKCLKKRTKVLLSQRHILQNQR